MRLPVSEMKNIGGDNVLEYLSPKYIGGVFTPQKNIGGVATPTNPLYLRLWFPCVFELILFHCRCLALVSLRPLVPYVIIITNVWTKCDKFYPIVVDYREKRQKRIK